MNNRAKFPKITKLIYLLFIIFLIIGCEEDPVENSLDDLLSITISHNGNSDNKIKENAQMRFFAEGKFKDGTTKAITGLTWSSSNKSAAVIDNDGLFVSVRSGTTQIIASHNDMKSNTIQIRVVSENGLQSLITSVAGSPSKFFVGETYQLKSVGVFGNGDEQDMTESVTWHSSDESIATISNHFGSEGKITILKSGSIAVYSELTNIDSNQVGIITEDVSLSNIKLSIVKDNAYIDEKVKLSVIGTYSNGDEKNITNDVNWIQEAGTQISINNDEVFSSVAGVYTFHAKYDGKESNSVNFTVTEREGVLESIEISSNLEDGADIFVGETLIEVKAKAIYNDHEEDITDLVWTFTPANPDDYIFEAGDLLFGEPGDYTLQGKYENIDSNILNFHVQDVVEEVVAPTENSLIINELLPKPPSIGDNGIGGDANGDGIKDGTQDEFIEIVNISDKIIDLTGVYLTDSKTTDNIIAKFPDNLRLRPNKAIVIFGGGNPTGDFGGSTVITTTYPSLSLNNSGDIITINYDNGTPENLNDDIAIYSMLYDDSFANLQGSAVLYPELGLGNEMSYRHHCDPTVEMPDGECSGTYFSPGTKTDGSNF